MQIIKDKNNIVVFAGDGFELTTSGLVGKKFKAPGVKSSTHVMEIVESIPDDWVGGYYTYTASNGFTRTQSGETAAIETAAASLSKRKAELAALRYKKETSGIVVDGFDVATDRDSQQMLLTLYFYFGKNSNKEINFKGKKTWKKLTASEFDKIISATANHVQACFTREMKLSLSLESDINTDITTGWPT